MAAPPPTANPAGRTEPRPPRCPGQPRHRPPAASPGNFSFARPSRKCRAALIASQLARQVARAAPRHAEPRQRPRQVRRGAQTPRAAPAAIRYRPRTAPPRHAAGLDGSTVVGRLGFGRLNPVAWSWRGRCIGFNPGRNSAKSLLSLHNCSRIVLCERPVGRLVCDRPALHGRSPSQPGIGNPRSQQSHSHPEHGAIRSEFARDC